MDFSFLFALYQGGSGFAATADDCAGYANTIGNPDFPVFADGEEKIKSATPMTQNVHPEMCALSPALEILYCTSGHGGYESTLDAIREHAASN